MNTLLENKAKLSGSHGAGAKSTPPRNRAERGASVVEFALIVPMFIAILFGILDFGLVFDDSGQLDQTLRQTGRQAAVADFGPSTPCTLTGVPAATTPNIRRLMCLAKTNSQLGSEVRIKVAFYDRSLTTEQTSNGFVVGNSVLLCSTTPIKSATGFYNKVLNDNFLTARVAFRIEQPSPGAPETGGAETDPSGRNWSWCK